MLVWISVTSLCLLARARGEDKLWQWSNNYEPAKHWAGGRPPSPGQSVLIPGDVVFLSSAAFPAQLHLGQGGMLVMGRNSSISLTKPTSSPPLRPATFKAPRPGAWLDPTNWSPGLTPRPHSEQVPCHHDKVVFPRDMTYLVSIRESDVTVGQLSLAGKTLDSVGWRSVVRTEVGQRMFNVSQEVKVTGSHCRDWKGCQCGTDHLEDIICRHAGGTQCEPTSCSQPLKPRGHCCYNYCGAVISLTSSAGMDTLTTIASHHAGSSSRFHVRRIQGDNYQILLVPDSGNLTATHQAAAHIQSYLLLELRSSVSSVWVEYSGAGPPPGPLARTLSALGWISLFSLVTLAAVFLNRRYSVNTFRQDDLRALRTSLESQFRLVSAVTQRLTATLFLSGFAMFKNTEEGEVELRGVEREKLEDPEEQDSAGGEMAKSEEMIGMESGSRSFSNPMFNIAPPANVYSEEPTKDITFGVENPTYVALEKLGKDNNSDKGSHHYEVIDIESPTQINQETESKTSLGQHLLNGNKNEETENVVAIPANELFEMKVEDNEMLVELSDIFENNQNKEEQSIEDISDADKTISDIDIIEE